MQDVDIHIPGSGGTYRLHIEPIKLHNLACGILQYLGESFEIRPMREPGELRKEQTHIRARLGEESQMYANEKTPYDNEMTREEVKVLLAEAYMNGWRNAPKGIGYALQSRGPWTP